MYTKFFDSKVYIYFYNSSDKARRWCIPNLFSGAIELKQVCGRSPMACVIVECKAQHSAVENGSNITNELVLIICLYKTSVQSWQLVYLPG